MGWWILSFCLIAIETWGSVYFFGIFMERKRTGWLDKCRYMVLYLVCVAVTSPRSSGAGSAPRKGKINQAILLRSFQHLEYFCECLSVLDHYATDDQNNLYQSIKEIFKRPRPKQAKVESENLESSNTALPE